MCSPSHSGTTHLAAHRQSLRFQHQCVEVLAAQPFGAVQDRVERVVCGVQTLGDAAVVRRVAVRAAEQARVVAADVHRMNAAAMLPRGVRFQRQRGLPGEAAQQVQIDAASPIDTRDVRVIFLAAACQRDAVPLCDGAQIFE